MNQGYGGIMNCQKETFWGKSMKHSICIGLSVFVLITTACQATPPPLDETAPQTQLADNAEVPLSVLKRLKNPPKVPVEVLLERIEIFEKRSADKRFDSGYFRNQNPRVGYGFSSRGWDVTVHFDNERYVILAESLEIVGVRHLDRRPKDVTSSVNGWVDTEELRDIAVEVSKEDAQVAAIRFVESHWDRVVLEGLGEADIDLWFNGSSYQYLAKWSSQATGNRILFGVRSVRVYVNPTTGEVFEMTLAEIEAPKYSKIGPEEFLKMVEEEFQSLNGAEVMYIQSFTGYDREMMKRSYWSANIRYTCPKGIPITCYGHASIRIDADTGEILERSAQ